MTGGLSVITKDDLLSYNRAVNAINQNQRNNIRKLSIALDQANSANNQIRIAYNNLSQTMNELKRKVFINQALCDNFDISRQGSSSDTGYGPGLSGPIKYRMDILQ